MIKSLIAVSVVLLSAGCARQGSKTAESTEIDSKKTFLAGGYSQQRPLTEEEKTLFQQVTAELDGVRYTPESVATQVVAGRNYKFICKAVTATREPQTYQAEVVVYQPLPNQGEPKITKITKL